MPPKNKSKLHKLAPFLYSTRKRNSISSNKLCHEQTRSTNVGLIQVLSDLVNITISPLVDSPTVQISRDKAPEIKMATKNRKTNSQYGRSENKGEKKEKPIKD